MVGVRKIHTLALPQFIAHRGASSKAPENTLIAMQKAAQLGAKWVEFDVVLSADGVPVIFHDEQVSRTTNGYGLIYQLSLSQIKQLDAGGWFATSFSGERVPTLTEMVRLLAQLRLGFNIEIKPDKTRSEETVEAALEVIAREWPANLSPPLYSSFSLPALRHLRKIKSEVPIGLLLHEAQAQWQYLADELNCVSIHLNREIVTPEWVSAIKATQRYVLSYTVNSEAIAQQLFSLGVDAVFTDKIQLLS